MSSTGIKDMWVVKFLIIFRLKMTWDVFDVGSLVFCVMRLLLLLSRLVSYILVTLDRTGRLSKIFKL